MTDAQVAELEQALTASLKSSTIEWAMNMRICDLLQANPSLTPSALERLDSRLRKESPVPVLLALSLLEMVVKNCGLMACRFIDAGLVSTLVSLVKKREGWRYGLGRSLHKSAGSWLPQGLGINEDERKLWHQASLKVREMLQLWVDAFLLQEGELQPIFEAYKKLRRDGYSFPRGEHGTSTGLCLVHGAEESPAFLAGAGGGGSVAAAPAAAAGGLSPVGSAASGGGDRGGLDRQQQAEVPQQQPAGDAEDVLAEVVAVREVLDSLEGLPVAHRGDAGLAERLASARSWAMHAVERHTEEQHLSEAELEAVLVLLEDLNGALAGDEEAAAGAASSSADAAPTAASAAAVPPPPSEAPPDREQQELYDLILARYLQERENEAFFVNEEEDAALAWRLSMEDGGPGAGAAPGMAECARCRAVNQLMDDHRAPHGGPRLFVCYVCGTTQRVPPPLTGQPAMLDPAWRPELAQRRAVEEPRPARHAPPARVIRAGDASPELLISAGGAEAADFDDPPRDGAASKTAPSRPALASFGSSALTEPLFGGAGSEALLGAPMGASSSTKAWAKSMRSWVPSGSSGAYSAKRLGDGTPSDEYAELGGEETAAPLTGGPPRSSKSGSKHSSSLLPWPRSGRSKGTGEAEESLLERVRVDGDWELIRPPDGRPYWYNSGTQVSQWEPPDVVRRGR